MKNTVFVHGFMGSALNWGPLLTHLRKSPELSGWTHHAVDLLGHGGRRTSPLGSYEKLNLDLMAEDLWLQVQGFQPFIAVGHSFGLRPLLRLATKYPQAFSGLIVEDSSPQVDRANYEFLKKILGETPQKFATRSSAQEFFQLNYPGRLAAFLLSNIRENTSTKEHEWRFDWVGLNSVLDDAFANPQWSDWEKLSFRARIIRGENSDFLSKDRVAEMLARINSPCDFAEVENSGHWIHSDNFDGFSSLIIQTISSWDG